MNEVKTTFGILPGINSNDDRVSGTVSVTSYDGITVFHVEINVDEMLIAEIGDFDFEGQKYNARCGDIRYDYYFNFPQELLEFAAKRNSDQKC